MVPYMSLFVIITTPLIFIAGYFSYPRFLPVCRLIESCGLFFYFFSESTNVIVIKLSIPQMV